MRLLQTPELRVLSFVCCAAATLMLTMRQTAARDNLFIESSNVVIVAGVAAVVGRGTTLCRA